MAETDFDRERVLLLATNPETAEKLDDLYHQWSLITREEYCVLQYIFDYFRDVQIMQYREVFEGGRGR